MTKTRKIIKENYEYALCFLLMGIISIIAINPTKYMSATLSAIIIWAKLVLPSLFCFFFLTKIFMSFDKGIKIFSSVGKPFAKFYNNNDLSLYIFLMSIISGYPVGAKLLSELYQNGQISQDEAHRLLPLASNCGPMFILGSLTSMMNGNSKIGKIVLLSHILSSIILALFFRKKSVKNDEKTQKNMVLGQKKEKLDINKTMYDTIISVFMVGGYIALCYTLLELIGGLGVVKMLGDILSRIFGTRAIGGVMKGLVEMTSGCIEITALNLSPTLLTCLLSMLVTFGGLSIHLQSNIFLSKAKIKYGYFLKIKIFQSIIAILLSWIICQIMLI